MGELLGGTASPIGWVVSYVAAPASTVTRTLVDWREGLGGSLRLSQATPYPACLDLLEPLTVPQTIDLLIDCGPWTAVLSNHATGGDPTAPAPYLADRLAVRCVIAMHSARYGPGHGGTQLWIHGPNGKPPLMYERTIDAVAEDGHWTWHESGVVQPFEDPLRYGARRVCDRFNRDLLITYLDALGIQADIAAYYRTGIAIERLVDKPVLSRTRSEAMDWLQAAAP